MALKETPATRVTAFYWSMRTLETGGPNVLQTFSCQIQLLRPHEKTRTHRHTSTTVYHAFRGEGTAKVSANEFNWTKGDIFVAMALPREYDGRGRDSFLDYRQAVDGRAGTVPGRSRITFRPFQSFNRCTQFNRCVQWRIVISILRFRRPIFPSRLLESDRRRNRRGIRPSIRRCNHRPRTIQESSFLSYPKPHSGRSRVFHPL